jgi:transcriptional regulator NrdR family protein
MKARWIVLAGAVVLAGCGKDHQGSETYDASILRESQCVAASERFQLYDEAKKHTEHAKSAEDERFDKTKLSSDLGEKLKEARIAMIAQDKSDNAAFLKNRCNTEVPQDQFNAAD